MTAASRGTGRGGGRLTVLMVAYHFAPSSLSGTHRALHFARSLVEAGHDVRIITTSLDEVRTVDPRLEQVFPWPDRVTRVASAPTLGRHWLRAKRRMRPAAAAGSSNGGGVVAPAAADSGGVWRRLRRHVAVWDNCPDAQRGWLGPAVRAGVEAGRAEGASLVFASGPPWTAVVAGSRVARRLNVPLIADFRDPWTPRSGATWRYETGWAQRLAGRMEARVGHDARILLFNSPTVAERAVQGFGPELAGRVRTILNGSAAPRRPREAPFPTDLPLWVRHFGTLYAGRSISPLLEGLRGLIAANVGAAEVGVDLVGSVSEDLRQAAPDGLILQHRPALPFSEAVRDMHEPAVLAVVQPPRLNGQIPTKLYDYLCTGNPILVLAPEESATWAIASRYSRARRLDPEPTERNRMVLAELLDDWRSGRLRQHATIHDTAHLTKEAVGQDFVNLVASLVGSP